MSFHLAWRLDSHFAVSYFSINFFLDYWLFTILLYIAVMGIANLVAVIIPGKGKGLIANGLIVILWSFGGRTSYIAKLIPLSITF